MAEYEYFNGVIAVGEDSNDYLLSGDTTIPTLSEQDYVYYTYNQDKKYAWRSDCTLFGPFTAISALFNYKLNDGEIEEIRDIAHSRGKIDNEGWYIQSGVKAVCDWRNEKHPDKTVIYYRTPINSEIFQEAVAKKHLVVVGINGNSKLTRDMHDDNIVESILLDGARTYGHCLCNSYAPSLSGVRFVDSYNSNKETYAPDIKSNEYIIKDKAIFNGNIYQASAYIILPKPDDTAEIERLKAIKAILDENMTANSEQWNVVTRYADKINDKDFMYEVKLYQDALHRFNEVSRKKLATVTKMLS